VIDAFVADPDRLVRKATAAAFAALGAMFPGMRAVAPLSYRLLLESVLNPLLRDCFGLAPAVYDFPMCHYSLVTQPPTQLRFLQRVPHIDSVGADGLATVHYLFHGGLGRYRVLPSSQHRLRKRRRRPPRTYFLRNWNAKATATTRRAPATSTATPRCSSVIASVDAAYNRLIVYRRNCLHSGNIDSTRMPPADPLAGRLSINSFIDVATAPARTAYGHACPAGVNAIAGSSKTSDNEENCNATA
jgi:hypothetical protein